MYFKVWPATSMREVEEFHGEPAPSDRQSPKV